MTENQNIQLLAAIPCRRFDYEPPCRDGRGGWVYSQVGAERFVKSLENAWLFFGFSILVTPSCEEDFVEATRLVATMNGEVIGESELDWRIPNKGGSYDPKSGKIYEWMQDINLAAKQGGLVSIEIGVQLNSAEGYQPVQGRAFSRINQQDANGDEVSRAEYFWKRLLNRRHLSETKREW